MILAKNVGSGDSVRPERPEQVIEYLPVGCLEVVFTDAQRAERPRRIAKIKAEFNEDRITPAHIMRLLDGRNHIADGQNLRKAMLELFGPDKMIPCIVKYGNTAEEAANLFIGYNTDRDPVKTYDFFNVKLVAKDPETVDIHRIAKSYGYNIGNGPEAIRAVSALTSIYRMKSGAKVLDSTLGFIRNVWPNDPVAIDGIILKGVGSFFSLYGDDIDKAFWKQVAKVHRSDTFLAKAKSNRDVFGGNSSKAIVAILRSTYNNRRAKKLVEK
jgi:hypothetical protein